MTYRILVPLDGSELAERAIPWADELAGGLQASVELLRVVPHDIRWEAAEAEVQLNRRLMSAPEPPMGVYRRLVEEEKAEVGLALSRARSRFSRAKYVETTVLAGWPADMIVARAHITEATLVAMASRGRGGVTRALLGSVASAVIRRSGVPVLAIRADLLMPPHIPKRVLVPLDTSDLARAVLGHVVPLAQQLDWTLVLYSVTDIPPQTIPIQGAAIPLGRTPSQPPAEVMEYLDHVAGDLRSQGLTVEVEVGSGDRAQAIVEAAHGTRSGLIAMSTHGRHGLGRWALGSVTDAVLRQAEVPVLAVRPLQMPASSTIPLHRAEAPPANDEPSLTVTLTGRQVRTTRLALEHLAWSASRHDEALEDIRGALGALDAAAHENVKVSHA